MRSDISLGEVHRNKQTPAILKRLNATSRVLAELKGVASSIPHQGILINTLGMQEAKDSSAIENIVTTHDDLFRDDAFPESGDGLAAKEVLRYRQALRTGFESVRQKPNENSPKLDQLIRKRRELRYEL